MAVGTDTGRMVLSGADSVLPLLAGWEKTPIVQVSTRHKESSHEAHAARHRQLGRPRPERRGVADSEVGAATYDRSTQVSETEA